MRGAAEKSYSRTRLPRARHRPQKNCFGDGGETGYAFDAAPGRARRRMSSRISEAALRSRRGCAN